MIPSELNRLIRRDLSAGKTPFFVNSTAGTTVTGSYDPINDIADVAEEHGMWLHIDVS
jgi:glutamate decarboxylase